MWYRYRLSGLWSKEYHQVRVMSWVLLLLGGLLLPGARMMNWWFANPKEITQQIQQYGSNSGPNEVMIVMLLFYILASILSLWQLGMERKATIQEFTLALPYSRRAIYTSKWGIGCLMLLSTSVFIVLLDSIVIVTSQLGDIIDWGTYWTEALFYWTATLSVYSIAMFVGTIAGSYISHALSLVFLVVFQDYLIKVLDVFERAFDLGRYGDRLPMQDYFTLQLFIPVQYTKNWLFYHAELQTILFSLGISALMYTAGAYVFKHNRAENNGRLFIFPVWERIAQIILTVCVALFGGMIAYNQLGRDWISYLIGFCILGVIGYFIIVALTRKRFRV